MTKNVLASNCMDSDLALSLGWVILGKLCNLSETQFPPLQNEGNNEMDS